jgi:hypothetical protein
MTQLGANDTELDIVLEDILDNFAGISNLKRDDKMRILLFKTTHQFGEEIFPRNGACPQGKFSPDPLGEFTQGIEQLLTKRQDLGGISKKDPPCLGETDLPAGSVKKAKG